MPEDKDSSNVVSLVKISKEKQVNSTEIPDQTLTAAMGKYSSCIVIGVDKTTDEICVTYGGEKMPKSSAYWMLMTSAHSLLNQIDFKHD